VDGVVTQTTETVRVFYSLNSSVAKNKGRSVLEKNDQSSSVKKNLIAFIYFSRQFFFR